MRAKRHGYYDDIKLSRIFPKVILFTVIVGIVVLGFVFWRVHSINKTAKENAQYNEFATNFNAHPVEERELIEPFMIYQNKLDEETNTLPLAEENWIGFWDYAAKWRSVIVCLLLASYSILVVFFYSRKRDKDYRWTDIPNNIYGWFLLMNMFIVWPFFLIAKGLVVLGETLDKMEAIRKSAELALLADSEVELQATEQDYRDFITHSLGTLHESTTNEARSTIRSCDKRLKEISELQEVTDTLREEIRSLNSQKSLALAAIRQSEEQTRSDVQLRNIHEEWEAICNMRGVISVRIIDNMLVIKVRVHYPLNGKEYDLGDYKLEFWPSSFSSEITRPSVKQGRDNTLYPNGDGFCFGDRGDTIKGYVTTGSYAEAATIAIDSLHGVNNQEDEKKIPDLFWEVEKTERAMRKIQSKMKEERK